MQEQLKKKADLLHSPLVDVFKYTVNSTTLQHHHLQSQLHQLSLDSEEKSTVNPPDG